MREDQDAQCTREQIYLGQGKRRVNNQEVKPGNHTLQYTDGRQESSRRGHRNRVETRKSVIQ